MQQAKFELFSKINENNSKVILAQIVKIMIKKINQTLRELRKIHGYTQLDIAMMLDIDNSTYAKIEQGVSDINLSKLELISNIYKMSVVELLAYPNLVKEVYEPLKPKVSIIIDVYSDNQEKAVTEVLEKIEGIEVKKQET